METDNITLADIDVKQIGGDAKFFIQTECKDGGREGFHLTLSDGLHVWDGTLSEDDLDKLSTKRKMDFNTYVEQTKAAFTKETVSDLCFEYHLSQAGDASATFVWKKHIVGDDIKFQLGSVKLKQCDQPAKKLCQLLTGCVLRSQQLHTQIRNLKADNDRLSLDRQNALKRLDKCVTAKEVMEKELYSKFSTVLNSKKERIRHLVENGALATLDDVPSTSGRPMSPEKGEDVRPSPLRDEDDYDIETDEEESPQKRRRIVGHNPVKLSAETSVNLGEEDEEENDKKERKAPVARRPRRQAPTRKQTPAKPVLPRVSSGNSASRSDSRKSSLRKSGSENSNKSSDNLDPDDLLNNL